MEEQEMRDLINSTTKWIAYKIYGNASGKNKFIKAYDRLVGKVFLDHNMLIRDMKQESQTSHNIFDNLNEHELSLVLESVRSLQKMYNRNFEEVCI